MQRSSGSAQKWRARTRRQVRNLQRIHNCCDSHSGASRTRRRIEAGAGVHGPGPAAKPSSGPSFFGVNGGRAGPLDM